MRLLGFALLTALVLGLAVPSGLAHHDEVRCSEYQVVGDAHARECYGMNHGGTEQDCDAGGSRWWITNSTIVLEGMIEVDVREQAGCQGRTETYQIEVAGDGDASWLRIRWWDGAGSCGIRGEVDVVGPRYGQTAPCVLDMGPPTDANSPP